MLELEARAGVYPLFAGTPRGMEYTHSYNIGWRNFKKVKTYPKKGNTHCDEHHDNARTN